MNREQLIRLVNVAKLFNPGRADEVRALEDVTLEIGRGAYAIFFGASGSGKTTLLGLMATIDRPTSGNLFIDGRDVTHFSELELSRIRRNLIGIVFQSFHLFPRLSAWENVAYPLIPVGVNARDRFARAAALLERLDLADRLHHAPEELSGGQQQRVAIARSLVNDPEIVIADEPTSNIDQESTTRLLDILAELNDAGKTIIVSSHDPVFREQGDVMFTLSRGRLDTVSRRTLGREKYP